MPQDHGWTAECQALIAQIRHETPERDDILHELAADTNRMASFRWELEMLTRAIDAATEERRAG